MRELVIAAMAAGCYSPSYNECRISCASSQTCPSGYHCSSSGYCTTSSESTACRAVDAPTGDVVTDSVEADAPYPSGPWGNPMVIEMNPTSAVSDDDPSVTEDGAELYFNRAGQNVFLMTWTGNVWSSPTMVASPISMGTENGPFISADGLHLYFDSTRSPSTGGRDLWMSERATRNSPWGTPAPLTVLNSATLDAAPWVSRDETAIVFDSDRPPATNGRIHFWISTRATKNDPWGTPQLLNGPPDGADNIASSCLSPDQRVLYLADYTSTGVVAVYQSIRASTSDPFPAPTAIPELASGADDEDPWVSLDGHTMYFGSNRNVGFWAILEAKR